LSALRRRSVEAQGRCATNRVNAPIQRARGGWKGGGGTKLGGTSTSRSPVDARFASRDSSARGSSREARPVGGAPRGSPPLGMRASLTLGAESSAFAGPASTVAPIAVAAREKCPPWGGSAVRATPTLAPRVARNDATARNRRNVVRRRSRRGSPAP